MGILLKERIVNYFLDKHNNSSLDKIWIFYVWYFRCFTDFYQFGLILNALLHAAG